MAGKGNDKKPKKVPESEGESKHTASASPPDEPRAEQEKKNGEHFASESEAMGDFLSEDGYEKEPEDQSGKEEGKFPIVALGASAGGLEAIEAFFDAVPADTGISFVVITHTDPTHQSMLPDLIKRRSKISVKVIEEGMAIEPDTVYLPPSDRDPVLSPGGGTFSLKERPARSRIHMPVDLFLKQLAEERGEAVACVILSGTGTDGTLGLRLIKEKAGLAIAQSLDSARHEGMPRSAVDTGLVDYILPPQEMPARLVGYFKHSAVLLTVAEGEKERVHDALGRILDFLTNQTRHDFSLYKENTLIRRIERRMIVTHSRNASDYLGCLHQDPKEVQALFQDLLIGVTGFFRDPEAFVFLKEEVFPELIARTTDETFRVWIPGCSSGEEAYSVAIILSECLRDKGINRAIQIFGTDIDSHAIENARQGIYIVNIASDVSPERLDQFFTKEENHYRVKSDIRELVLFAEQDVLSDPPFSKLDLLVCRNLLIYLKTEAQNRLIQLFHYALRDGGILFLGSSEGVGRYQNLFEPLSRQYSIYRKKNHLVLPAIQFPYAKRLGRQIEGPEPEKRPERPALGVKEAIEKVLMERHTPACVLVNRSGEILHVHGRTGKYLELAPGAPTLQIAEVAREGLRFALLSVLREADEGKGEIRKKDVRVKINHDYQRIDLVVESLSEPPLRDCRLVIFEELPEPAAPEQGAEGRSPGEEDAGRVEALEQELMRLRQDYRNAVEELQTSNEELRSMNEEQHSSNEELQSTNEELESSREELQSLNEELNTVNSELYNKIEDVKEAYTSVNDVLNNTRIAIIFLDNDLRVKRFTSEASQLLNLIDSDVGRPIEHISHNLEGENLLEKARVVLKELTGIDEEVHTRDGHWYSMRIMVYRTEAHSIEGVVLTFINIDAQKAAQKQMEETSAKALSSARRFAENIVDTVRESLLVLDSRMQVVTANRSFYDTFRTTANDTEGKRLFDLGEGQWDILALRNLLEEIIEKKESFQDYLVEHRFPEIGLKRMMLNARLLHDEDKEQERILLAIENVTERLACSREEME